MTESLTQILKPICNRGTEANFNRDPLYVWLRRSCRDLLYLLCLSITVLIAPGAGDSDLFLVQVTEISKDALREPINLLKCSKNGMSVVKPLLGIFLRSFCTANLNTAKMNLQYKNRLVLESPAPRSGKVVQNRPRQNRLRHGEQNPTYSPAI